MNSVSITCIDSLNYIETITALKSTIKTVKDKVNLTKIYWFSDIDFPDTIEIPVVWVKINRIKCYIEEYNFITLKLVPHIVTEDFNLIIHGDGFAVNPDAWDNVFFEYDYIGAAWGDGFVGNGGFSLRSRKLYDAILDLNINYSTSQFPEEILNTPTFFVIDSNGNKFTPEDTILCRIYKNILSQDYGVKWAPVSIADRFSIESNMHSEWLGLSLGFHGKHGVAPYYGVTL
jgi:hypothetical protein